MSFAVIFNKVFPSTHFPEFTLNTEIFRVLYIWIEYTLYTLFTQCWLREQLVIAQWRKSSHRGALYKKMFTKISQNSLENTCVSDSFLINLQASDTQNPFESIFLATQFWFSPLLTVRNNKNISKKLNSGIAYQIHIIIAHVHVYMCINMCVYESW